MRTEEDIYDDIMALWAKIENKKDPMKNRAFTFAEQIEMAKLKIEDFELKTKIKRKTLRKRIIDIEFEEFKFFKKEKLEKEKLEKEALKKN